MYERRSSPRVRWLHISLTRVLLVHLVDAVRSYFNPTYMYSHSNREQENWFNTGTSISMPQSSYNWHVDWRTTVLSHIDYSYRRSDSVVLDPRLSLPVYRAG